MIKINFICLIINAFFIIFPFVSLGSEHATEDLPARQGNSKKRKAEELSFSTGSTEHRFPKKLRGGCISTNRTNLIESENSQTTLQNLPKEIIRKITGFARIVDGIALASTCHSFISLLNDNALWNTYVKRIPGHQIFSQEQIPAKNIFKKLMKPYFCPLVGKSDDLRSEVYAMSNNKLTFWGSETNTCFEDADEDKETVNAAFWAENSMDLLPTFQKTHTSSVEAVSHDSNVIVGWDSNSSSSRMEAVVWLRLPSNKLQIKHLTGFKRKLKNYESIAKATNNNGTKIVGSLYTHSKPCGRAVVWEEERCSYRCSYLETSKYASGSFATGIDSTGDKIVGVVLDKAQRPFAALWRDNIVSYLPWPRSAVNSRARAISGNGQTIAGYVEVEDNNGDTKVTAAAWRLGGISQQVFYPIKCDLLPMLTKNSCKSVPYAISANGNRIVGSDIMGKPTDSYSIAYVENLQSAVIWVYRGPQQESSIYSLQALLGEAVPAVYHLEEATCVDPSGVIIAGNGFPSAWWAYLPDASAFAAEGIKLQLLQKPQQIQEVKIELAVSQKINPKESAWHDNSNS